MSKFNLPTQGIPTVANAYADVLGSKSDSQIIDIPNDDIIENNTQKFIIHEDTIEQLAERIKIDGQLSPCLVTPLPNGKYELIDGRHRRRAVILAGLPTTKCIIKNDLTDNQKATYRITLNLARNNDYLPSEIAFSLKELIELEGEKNTIKQVAEDTSQSRKKIYRYLRLTNLIQPLLNRVDSGAIPLIAGVELSYLTSDEQSQVFIYLLNHSDVHLTTSLAREIKENPNDLENIFSSKSNDTSFSDGTDNSENEEINEVDKVSASDDEIEETEKKPKKKKTSLDKARSSLADLVCSQIDTSINEVEELLTSEVMSKVISFAINLLTKEG